MTWIDQRVAPGRVELVRAFVNSADLARGGDVLQRPADLRAWLVEHDLAPPGLLVDASDLERALSLRDAFRALLLRNGGGPDAPAATALVNDVAERAGLAPRLEAAGTTRMRIAGTGLEGALGALTAVMFDAIATGEWVRLRACATCQWAFYDTSRNRSSRWCDMRICGNRAKQQAFSRRRGASF